MRQARSSYHSINRRRLLTSKDGLTTVEFAFIAPVMMLLMMGIIEFSMIMFTQAVMESATSNTARMGKTGYTAPGLTRQQQLINNVAARTAGLLDQNHITVTMKTYDSFDNVDDPEPFIDANSNGMYNPGETYTDINGNGQWDQDMSSAGAGNANDIVVYTVTYPWPVTTPLVNTIIGSIFNISARMVVKNEPW